MLFSFNEAQKDTCVEKHEIRTETQTTQYAGLLNEMHKLRIKLHNKHFVVRICTELKWFEGLMCILLDVVG